MSIAKYAAHEPMNAHWLYDMVHWCVQCGRVEVDKWIQDAQRNKDTPREILATRVVYQQAQLAVHSHITPAAVGGIPGVRSALNAGAINLEIGFLIYRMVKSIFYQAAVYDWDQDDELVERILLILGIAVGHAETRGTLVGRGHTSVHRLINEIVDDGDALTYSAMIGQQIAQRFGGRGSLADMPVVGRPFFGAQNFMFVSAASLAGRYMFNDMRLSQSELDDLDRRMREWASTVLSLMVWMAQADGRIGRAEASIIQHLERRLVMPGMESQDVREELQIPPDWDRIRRQFRTQEERAGLLENILMVVWADGQKTAEEDRLCRRVAAELMCDRIVDDIEDAVRQMLEVVDPS